MDKKRSEELIARIRQVAIDLQMTEAKALAWETLATDALCFSGTLSAGDPEEFLVEAEKLMGSAKGFSTISVLGAINDAMRGDGPKTH